MATATERAKKRATESRLRAVRHVADGTTYYVVHNLKEHRKYIVGYNHTREMWLCHCEAAKAGVLCKHVARVRDREEQRIKEEALKDE